MIQEKIVLNGKYPLPGMITLPNEGSGPFPAVVLVHGSGPSCMDGTIGKVSFYKDIAHGLAERGIASIRYDKRSYAFPKEMTKDVKKYGSKVHDETIEDAIVAADFIKKDPVSRRSNYGRGLKKITLWRNKK
jgi:dienelactone hydrolase